MGQKTCVETASYTLGPSKGPGKVGLIRNENVDVVQVESKSTQAIMMLMLQSNEVL